MSDQKYRADFSKPQPDGAAVWCANWNFGPTISKITNCRLENLVGDMRATVYITGEPDTWFSIPAVCRIRGKRVKGYVTSDDERNYVFRHTYY